MEKELAEYFNPQQEYYLEKIEYQRIDSTPVPKELSLNVKDNINVELVPGGVKLTIARVLQFDPREVFYLFVSFGAILQFNDEGKNIDWGTIDIINEFKSSGDFATVNLMSRISLLIGQITSSFGQQPIILPGVIGR